MNRRIFLRIAVTKVHLRGTSTKIKNRFYDVPFTAIIEEEGSFPRAGYCLRGK